VDLKRVSNAIDSTYEVGHNPVAKKCCSKEETMKSSGTRLLRLIFSIAFLIGASSWSFALNVGDKAPEFELESSKGGKLKLSDLKGKNVLINFYVLDFSPT
jgi:AhpC/TSA family